MRSLAWMAVTMSFVLGACSDPDEVESASGTDSTTDGGTTDDGESSLGSSDESGGGCGVGRSMCGGSCVDLTDDLNHCGGCNSPCGPDGSCEEGVCFPGCRSDRLMCDGACVDVQADAMHCGACNVPCGGDGVCMEGACVVTCAGDDTACGMQCANMANDEAHCGGCDAPCDAGVSCVYGECAAADVHHVLISGQSLSVGSGSAVVSTEQPYENVSFNTGVRAGNANLTTFIPLVESAAGGLGETIGSGMANLATELAEASGQPNLRTLASANGIGGTPYSGLAQGTAAYATGIAQVEAGVAVALAEGLTYRMRAVTVVHGESDHIGGNLAYDADLLQWQADYEGDIQAITGQTAPIPLFLCQMSSQTAYGSATSVIPIAQLSAAAARPDRIFVVGPKYFLTYVDGVHIDGESERRLGEYYAKAVRTVLVDGEAWHPVSPREVTREGASIRVEFWVPAPPLQFDETLVTNPGNYGFEYFDDGQTPPSIASVELDGDDAVVITLTGEPTGTARVRYAYTGIAGQPGGATTGARGNLHDSDVTPSRHGYDLSNWAVHFDEAVP